VTIVQGRNKPKALKHLAQEHLGTTIQSGEHSPVEDARTALLLYQRFKKVTGCCMAANAAFYVSKIKTLMLQLQTLGTGLGAVALEARRKDRGTPSPSSEACEDVRAAGQE
jgi:hypothetical protein